MLLDEDVRVDVRTAFPSKIQVHTVASLGISGAEDTFVIGEAIARRCLIVTANKDFVPAYRNHEFRKGRDRRYFWGLIFLKYSTTMSQLEQLKRAVREIDYENDDILTVSSTGIVVRERLDGIDPRQKNPKKAS